MALKNNSPYPLLHDRCTQTFFGHLGSYCSIFNFTFYLVKLLVKIENARSQAPMSWISWGRCQNRFIDTKCNISFHDVVSSGTDLTYWLMYTMVLLVVWYITLQLLLKHKSNVLLFWVWFSNTAIFYASLSLAT